MAIKEGKEEEYVLPEYLIPREVTIKVVDDATGEPIADAFVLIFKRVIPTFPRRTDEKGEVKISSRIKVLNVLVRKDKYKLEVRRFEIPRPLKAAFEVRLKPLKTA